MKIFRDIISGDELFTDTFPMKLIDDLYYEVEGKSVVEKNLEVGDEITGGNKSAEADAEDEGADAAGETKGINVIISHRLQPVYHLPDKKAYKAYIKEYMKAVKAKLEETNPKRVEIFTKGAPGAVKKILEDFKDFEFHSGESRNPDAMAIPMNYRADGITPYFIFFKDGLIEEKC